MPRREPSPNPNEPQENVAEARPTPRTRTARWTKLLQSAFTLTIDTDQRLSAAIAETGQGPQDIFQHVINQLCDDLAIPQQMHPDDPVNPTARRRTSTWGEGLARVELVVRLDRNTKQRLAAACDKEEISRLELVETALNDYFDELGIPHA
ncbi:hypothetical protein ACIBH1_45590 [Nonomuraea sp. NPDC050663]|uniref:hypothetical protein n=1 Tax=Nonomuraea sp. NPDC050663 TaxID=3364370 RepID=UPI0037997292